MSDNRPALKECACNLLTGCRVKAGERLLEGYGCRELLTSNPTGLLPCPFCAGAPQDYPIEPHSHSPLLKALVDIPDHAGSHVVECGCGAGLIDETRDAVIARWNTRAAPDTSDDVSMWMVRGKHEGRWVYLYPDLTRMAVYDGIMERARREGFRGTIQERLKELGWEVVPMKARLNLATPEKSPAQMKHELLTSKEQLASEAYERWHQGGPSGEGLAGRRLWLSGYMSAVVDGRRPAETSDDSRDAARYRWMRDNGIYDRSKHVWHVGWSPAVEADVDEKIAAGLIRQNGRLRSSEKSAAPRCSECDDTGTVIDTEGREYDCYACHKSSASTGDAHPEPPPASPVECPKCEGKS